MPAFLFDCYPSPSSSTIVAWVKTASSVYPLRIPYQPTFTVEPDGLGLGWARSHFSSDARVGALREVLKRPSPGEPKARMLEVKPWSLHDLIPVATDLRKAIRCHGFRIYDVDHVAEARWMHERRLYPLAELQGDGTTLRPKDPLLREAMDAPIPDVSVLELDVEAPRPGAPLEWDLPLERVRLRLCTEGVEPREWILDCAGLADEPRVLRQLGRLVTTQDPDVLLTRGGDAWDVPYLLRRIRRHRLETEVVLGRHPDPEPEDPDISSSSMMTYGRVRYRGAAYYLRGRWHVDLSKKSLDDLPDRTSLDGILYIAKLCNRRVQEVARNGPGASLQQRQMDKARDEDVVLPWKRNLAERPKDVSTLAKLDRGGQIMFPRPGLYEDAWACDFSAYYPSIVVARNLSSDTLDCTCCPDGPVIPDLELRTCKKRTGHQVEVLTPIVHDRREIKRILRDPTTTPRRRQWAEAIKGELKGLGVVCFGYFRYRNARYGCAEIHQGIQAYGRWGMTRAKEAAETHGFEVLHELTDCVILQRPGATRDEVQLVLDDIQEATKVPMDVEGHYDWLVLLPRAHDPDVGVPNRYYGRFDTGELKTRGIEVRQHRTPPFIRGVQQAMLDTLAEADSAAGFMARLPQAMALARDAARQLRLRRVAAEDLFVQVRASRRAGEYRAPTAPAIALGQLERAGVQVEPGQTFRMLLTRSGAGAGLRVPGAQKAIAAELVRRRGEAAYDTAAYLRLLARATQGILAPFGAREADLVRRWSA